MNPNDTIDIAVVNLAKSYANGGKTEQIFNDLQLEIKQKSFVAILGPSGCGKSTLLRLLSQAETPDQGTVKLNDAHRNNRRAHIEQKPALLPWRTALQNAYIGGEIRLDQDKENYAKNLKESFQEFHLNGYENYYPAQLSGGMQQRVAVIRALQSKPAILFCDEPFSAIDFVTRLELDTVFKRKCHELQCTTIFVTHNIDEAIFLADRIIVFNQERPCRIVADMQNPHGKNFTDAVQSRLTPEFNALFEKIWGYLQ
ncbi:nitrate/sulfonate/bicarbonate ABC transporter ATP-binding protein [Planctomycetales bacterium]|nr:nitrate/sulfonate/bicarbonate ABC transporter ATP-binding protein [Planctomycetales bacterium]GHS96383.1 nitrate/sulfonate/bicarbonate ABC transporter ATP-binding protein [Planctomycetales bacterium]GHT03022.1 nitrate/sulfonate/bicarbonate ABC transporter ATP-binding protein [Planctomycetales bacterium]